MRYSWGRLPLPSPAQTLEGDWRFQQLPRQNKDTSMLPHGLGRSYGDSCINAQGSHISTAALSRFISFDAQTGILECEGGVTLADILQLCVPEGWFLSVVPGTRYVTLGGAIANDVHGKNHHRAGSFGCHVVSLELLRSDGARPRCSAAQNTGLFKATIGGLGLTGLITRATIQLLKIPSDQLVSEDIAFASLEEFSHLSEESKTWDYTVAWIDSTAKGQAHGRGIFSRARHDNTASSFSSTPPKSHLGIPFSPPFSLVRNISVKLFNRAYFFAKNRSAGQSLIHYQPFFFPLDSLSNWNRIYGKAGFYQYQCVIPREQGVSPVRQLLKDIQTSGEGSFLTVLKEFGSRQSPGLLSFPRPGLTLAIDFPNRGEKTLKLMKKLDQTVIEAGGALYPAKDARMSAEIFHSGYPDVTQFKPHIDPGFSSSFWRRLQL